jgi:LPPG:FO 2-phospho-L-lactate transferase
MTGKGHVIALCGGVGGAKLAFGLARLLAPQDLTIVVNTGDDFEHLGLMISPDIDTVAYTLSDLADRERGWGRKDESWNFMAALTAIGGEDWFNLGDRDLAMHVERTRRLAAGETLSRITAELSAALGVGHAVTPMSDQPVRTKVETFTGTLPFQQYFVRERCEPKARAVHYEGAMAAKPAPAFAAALARSDIAAVVLCPSNPYLSIDPILAIPGVRAALKASGAPLVAVSPIIGKTALKGPAAKLMAELGAAPGVIALADHYAGLITGLVIDHANAHDAAALRARGVEARITDAIMHTDEDRQRLARETLELAGSLAARIPADCP